MTPLELTLLSLAQRHPRIFKRIADAYRAHIQVDLRTGREFQEIPGMLVLQDDVTEQEFKAALITVCKELRVLSQESA